MARSDALLRLHKTLIGRRSELRKRLGIELADLLMAVIIRLTSDAPAVSVGVSRRANVQQRVAPPARRGDAYALAA